MSRNTYEQQQTIIDALRAKIARMERGRHKSDQHRDKVEARNRELEEELAELKARK